MKIRFEDTIKTISLIKKRVSKKYAGKVIYVTVSGSDLYGFPSKDSDVDYRGTFIMDSNLMLGLHRPRDVLDIKEPDVVMFELEKELKLALKGNCNIIEHINSKPIFKTVEYIKMKQLVNNALGKDGLYKSYRGMATFNYKKFILGGKANTKKYLYVLRGLMAGIYVLQMGRIEPNLEILNKHFKIPEVKQLIENKRAGIETQGVDRLIDAGELDDIIQGLFATIDDAYIKCKMPEQPEESEVKEINRFLIAFRKRMIT